MMLVLLIIACIVAYFVIGIVFMVVMSATCKKHHRYYSNEPCFAAHGGWVLGWPLFVVSMSLLYFFFYPFIAVRYMVYGLGRILRPEWKLAEPLKFSDVYNNVRKWES